MSAPHLLLVDDSQAILAFESAVLGAHYNISTAGSGRRALQMARELRPAAVLLDLSMPEMDGEQVLGQLQADAELRHIPVVVVSTEHRRADACLRAGAADFVPKPIRAEILRAVVDRVLTQARLDAERGNLAALFFEAGGLGLSLLLDAVHAVVMQPATVPVESGSPFVAEAFVLRGASVAVVDVPRALERAHTRPLIDRQLIVIEHAPLFALCVDDVLQPEVVPSIDVARDGESLAGATPDILRNAVLAVVRGSKGAIPVIDPVAFLPPRQ